MGAILVTGATGFVGTHLCRALADAGHEVRAASRATMGEIGAATDWSKALAGVEAVIHLAARAHVMRDRSADPLAEYRRINVEGTRRLAESCVSAGVRRLVFVSSIKANGEETFDRPYTENDPPRPGDAYGQSKLEAENVLRAIAAENKLEIAIVRPCVIYGPGVKGNILQLLRLAYGRAPLPLGSIRNQRSLLCVTNLCDLLIKCATEPAAAGALFLASDSQDISTPDLLRELARHMGKKMRLWPYPVGFMRFAARLLGKGAIVKRLTGSLQVDSSKARRALGWKPPVTLDQGLAEMARWYVESRQSGH